MRTTIELRAKLLWRARSPSVVLAFIAAMSVAPATARSQAPVDSSRARRDTVHTLEAVNVSAIRGGTRDAPISSTTLTTADIESRAFGQDVPLLLQGVPSLTSYSEAANYWGYSYIRIRGVDQSRINFTLDGIPLNDPEDQVLYFTDFPDLTNSISTIQVQRGVGTSAPGTASYGGSINFETIPVASARRAGQVQLQGGSFGSARASAEYASGLTTGGFAFYGRASALQSAGFRNHSGALGRSALFSVARVGERDILKLTATAGLFADTLAYYGATPTELARDRRFNSLRPDEVDHFGEQVASLTYTRDLGRGTSASTALYRISAKGNYDVCINACDQPQAELWNFHLDFAWYGATSTWSVERDRVHASVGANANTYARDHYAYARPDLTDALYFNTGHKGDVSAFGKLAYDIGAVTLFGDLQGRRAQFRYAPDPNAGIPSSSIAWSFLNPKMGATVRVTPAVNAYVSYGINSREPARSDMLGGFDNLDTSNAAFVGPLSRVRPERAHDAEAGVRYRDRVWSMDANAFAMEFRNEILPVGQLSYIGTPLRTNVHASWRRGVEVDVNATPAPAIRLGVSATVMGARIADFTDESTGQSYRNVEPLLTPHFTSTQRAALQMTPKFLLTVTGRYSSRAFLTNTDDPTLTLPSFHTADVSLDWMRGRHGMTLYVNNVGRTHGYASGHVSGGEARYYVLPPLNAFLVARIGM